MIKKVITSQQLDNKQQSKRIELFFCGILLYIRVEIIL